MEGSDDGVDVVDAGAGQGTEEGRDPGAGAKEDGDEGLALLDEHVGEGTDLGVDPAAAAGVLGEDDEAGAGLVKAGVDAGDDVVAGPDLPLVEPGVDAALAQGDGEPLDCGLVLARVTDEDAHDPSAGCGAVAGMSAGMDWGEYTTGR